MSAGRFQTGNYESVKPFGAMQEAGMAVNAFVSADRNLSEGHANAQREKNQHLKTIQSRFWKAYFAIIAAQISRRRGALEFADDERLFLDLGVVDTRMLSPVGETQFQLRKTLLEELKAKNLSGCYYLTEWFAHCQRQTQLEKDISKAEVVEDDAYAAHLAEARRRVLTRLAHYFTGLPGIPLEVSESMRSGELDRALIHLDLNALREPSRRNFLRRHNLWQLREQILAKARARVHDNGVLRLFDVLGDVYAREWRSRFEQFAAGEEEGGQAAESDTTVGEAVPAPQADPVLLEAGRMRMRMALLAAIDGREVYENVFHGAGPRLSKSGVAQFLSLAQSFDRELLELPPLVLVPCVGRGFFAWEAGCVVLALRPMVGVDDSLATGLAWYRIFDDYFNHKGRLRAAYMGAFPGAVFETDFPADYRAWLCRLTKGELKAMDGARRVFFRDHVGPSLKGPMLPANLRNVGPQTLVAICRRLEKQVAADDSDVALHRRLAIIYWHQGHMDAARLQFFEALRVAPGDGETLFTAGMFMRGQEDGEAASECFQTGSERAADTMWGIYCQDALANLI